MVEDREFGVAKSNFGEVRSADGRRQRESEAALLNRAGS